ncbi:Gfo/Idh/MocA family protein [Persephonella sp.]
MVKVGIVGLGYWGPNLLRNFSQHPYTDVYGICDIDSSKVDKLSAKYKEISFITTDYKELLKEDIDLVAIATPPETHYEIAKEALMAGKHILVEKPFTRTTREAEELIELAERKNLKIFVDHTFVFHPVVRKIKEIIDSGELGEVYYFDSERINLGLLQTGVNVIWDLAVHDFSIICYLFPDVNFVKINAFGSKHIHPYYEDIAHVMLESDNGLIAHVHVSWLSPVKIRKTIIGGKDKMLWWDDIHPFEKLKLYNSRIEIDFSKEDPIRPTYIKGDIITIAIDNYEPLYKEVENIVSCIVEDKEPEVDGYEGLKVVQLLEKCNKVMKRNV